MKGPRAWARKIDMGKILLPNYQLCGVLGTKRMRFFVPIVSEQILREYLTAIARRRSRSRRLLKQQVYKVSICNVLCGETKASIQFGEIDSYEIWWVLPNSTVSTVHPTDGRNLTVPYRVHPTSENHE